MINRGSSPPWRILFLGTDKFSIRVLKALWESRSHRCSRALEIVRQLDVVTKPSPSVVSTFVRETGSMRHYMWPHVDIQEGQYDVGVIASFGHLIPEKFIKLFPHGILNVHPSLLPRWRGATPIPFTILNGDEKSGVTIQRIHPRRFDVGSILLQEELTVPDNCTSVQLRDLLSQLGASMIIKALSQLNNLQDKAQDNRLATYSPKILQNDPMLYIDWNSETSSQVDKKFKAFHELRELKTYFGDKIIKLRDPVPVSDIWWYTLRDHHMASRPGSVVYIKNMDFLAIQCMDGLFGIREVVFRKTLKAKDFYNGYLSKPQYKYSQFCNVPRTGVDFSKPAQTITTRTQQHKPQKHWQLQMMRLAMSGKIPGS